MFYANNGMVASSDLVWLQGAFNALVGLFDKVGPQTNAGKTVGMVCHPCQAAGNLSTEAYGRRITGMGQSYRERLKDQVACGECGEILAVVSLLINMMTQHGRAAGRRRKWTTPAAGGETELPDVLSGKGRTAEMPHGGVPGGSGDKDGNAGALRAPSCP